MEIGDKLSWSRTFTEEDIRLFASLSGDTGQHHLMRDKQGRLMAHGLLTATLPTKIGGDMNFIARELEFEFHRPVFAGDTVLCEVTLVALDQSEPDSEFTRVESKWVCRNQHGKEVMTGAARGVVRNTSN
ncbi:MAG TPA: MaoC family dehydratase [Pyrinomonadaceae bacterium]|nr:MaoC family dehydratase [Pyrinomonadaceae bacterium]